MLKLTLQTMNLILPIAFFVMGWKVSKTIPNLNERMGTQAMVILASYLGATWIAVLEYNALSPLLAHLGNFFQP